MKNFALTIFAFCLSFHMSVFAQLEHELSFTIKNFGVNVDGSFGASKVMGTLDLNNPQQTKLEATVDVKTIDTSNSTRDEHLKEAEYFDAVNFPEIRFRSIALAVVGLNNYQLSGILTIKGSSQEVAIPLELETDGSQYLKGELSINRLDFGVGGRSLILSKTVVISLRLEVPKS